MSLRLVFFAFILLALLGDARIFLFVMNRFVFGDHREERSEWTWLMFATPPLLIVLTALIWPLNQWLDWLLSTRVVERFTPERMEEIAWSLALAKIGAAWLIIAAAVGSYWILDRVRANYLPAPPLIGAALYQKSIFASASRPPILTGATFTASPVLSSVSTATPETVASPSAGRMRSTGSLRVKRVKGSSLSMPMTES